MTAIVTAPKLIPNIHFQACYQLPHWTVALLMSLSTATSTQPHLACTCFCLVVATILTTELDQTCTTMCIAFYKNHTKPPTFSDMDLDFGSSGNDWKHHHVFSCAKTYTQPHCIKVWVLTLTKPSPK